MLMTYTQNRKKVKTKSYSREAVVVYFPVSFLKWEQHLFKVLALEEFFNYINLEFSNRLYDIVIYKMYLLRVRLFWNKYITNITTRYKIHEICKISVENEQNKVKKVKERCKIKQVISIKKLKGYN